MGAPPPYYTGTFLHYPTSPGVSASIMPLTLLAWITLSIWAETTVLTLKDDFKPLPSSVKDSLDLWFLLSYIGFLTKQECIAGPADHRYHDRLSTVSNGDIKSGLNDLLRKGKLTRAGDYLPQRPPPSTSPPLASPPPPVRQRPAAPSSADAQRARLRREIEGLIYPQRSSDNSRTNPLDGKYGVFAHLLVVVFASHIFSPSSHRTPHATENLWKTSSSTKSAHQ